MPEQNMADMLAANGFDFNAESANFEFLSKLPLEIKNRVAALKKNQLKGIDIEAKFYAKVQLLEKEFEAEFGKVFEERRKIVSGEYEPTEEECNLPILHGTTEEEIKELNEKSEPNKGEKGIPGFWSRVLKTAENVGDMIQEHDEPILNYLTDITVTTEIEPPGFTLYFHFSENPYFTNSVLKKQYTMMIGYEVEEPFDYDGPSVTASKGETINWADGKDVTKKVVKKKQKKGANAGKFLTKTVKSDSFFNFFDPPQVDQSGDAHNEEDEDAETQELLNADFELGQIIRDHIVPRAVLFYTGEAADPDLYDDFGEDEEESDDGEESD